MTQPLSRPEELPGQTYKLNWPGRSHVTSPSTISYRMAGGVRLRCSSIRGYGTLCLDGRLNRMISAVFRRGGDVSFVVDELKAVFDPRGGQWMQGRYVPSLLAIGDIIERHMIDIGFLPEPKRRI